MENQILKGTDIKMFPAVFGTSRLGGTVSHYNKKDALKILGQVLDSPVNTIDTANIYAQGNSEKLIGEAVKASGQARDKVYIATKGGYVLSSKAKLLSKIKPLVRRFLPKRPAMTKAVGAFRGKQMNQSFTAESLGADVEASLKRLRMDYIDIYQLHSPDSETLQSGEAFVALEDLKKEGKIRAHGVSILSWEDLPACVEGGTSFVQVEASLFGERASRAAALEKAQKAGVIVVARQTFGSGLLARDPETWVAEDFSGSEERLDIARDRHARLIKQGKPFEEVIRFLVRESLFPGFLFATTNPTHLQSNLKALEDAALSSDHDKTLREIFSPFC